MIKANINLAGEQFEVTVEETKYLNGPTAVKLMSTEGPFATLSVNIPASDKLPKGAFYAKHWSENEGMVEQLLEQKVIVPVKAPTAFSGMIDNIRAYRLVKE